MKQFTRIKKKQKLLYLNTLKDFTIAIDGTQHSDT